jgi:hypothetical protein
MTTPSQRKDELNCPASGATHSAQPYTQPDQATHNGSPHGNEGDFHEESSLSSVVSGYTQAASEVLTLAELESRVAVHAAVRSFGLMCAISVLCVTAWITLIASLSVWVWQAGVALPVVLLLGFGVFASSAAVLFVLLINTAKRITLRNTLAAVTGSPKV